MEGQISIFDILKEPEPDIQYKRLNIGDKVGRIVLGEVEVGTIYKVEGNDKYFFYRTDRGCFEASARTDIEKMEIEALENRKNFKIIEIDKFDKFFAIQYPPARSGGHETYAMVGIYKGMLFWKGYCTYQFLENVKNIDKAYKEKVHEITHMNSWDEQEREYEVLNEPISVKRLYYSKGSDLYSEANYVIFNP